MTKENNFKLNIENSELTLAPIVLFVYNRLDHTKQTLEALQKNELASESELFIYSDATKNEDVKPKVDAVREYIKTLDGFKNITIYEREKNWGLANSIIDGVTQIVNEYGKIIVLEDDLVTSPFFLKFMNEALEVYKDEEKVWHVSGWNYPIDTDGLDDVFLWRLMNCWGWATWKNKWQYFEKNIEKTILEFTPEDIKRFNIDDIENFWGQIISNKEGNINTWAIFWYASIFKKDGLCLNPTKSFVESIGNDDSGTHCGGTDIFKSKRSLSQNIKFTNNIFENELAIKNLKTFYKKSKKSILIRIKNKIRNFI